MRLLCKRNGTPTQLARPPRGFGKPPAVLVGAVIGDDCRGADAANRLVSDLQRMKQERQ
jgi:hypothetical protein